MLPLLLVVTMLLWICCSRAAAARDTLRMQSTVTD